MSKHKCILRTGREEPSANGYFVQNEHGATVAGPFETMGQAWDEQDRLDAKTKLRALGYEVQVYELEFKLVRNGSGISEHSSEVNAWSAADRHARHYRVIQ